jgi:hypothetical protein
MVVPIAACRLAFTLIATLVCAQIATRAQIEAISGKDIR